MTVHTRRASASVSAAAGTAATVAVITVAATTITAMIAMAIAGDLTAIAAIVITIIAVTAVVGGHLLRATVGSAHRLRVTMVGDPSRRGDTITVASAIISDRPTAGQACRMAPLRPAVASGNLFTRLIVIATVGLFIGACSSVRYYAQAATGQGKLIIHRRSLNNVVGDPDTLPALAARLRSAQLARRFASEKLGLPDNRSYRSYVELGRPYVVWNVFATPRYSVDAIPQCFPIAGCVAYRGWFSEEAARRDSAQLKGAGKDVWVGGVPAYSTLGWFADPIVSSMLRWDDDELDGTIFHELAHQLIYLKGDTAFNESFATFVQTEGLTQWRGSLGLPARADHDQAINDGFNHKVLDLRNRLRAVYAGGGSDTMLEAGKQREISAFRRDYAHWRDCRWPQDHRYDTWVAAPINNARLLPFGLYDQWVPAFAVLFERAGRRWPPFYASVRQLAAESASHRDNVLRALLPSGDSAHHEVSDGDCPASGFPTLAPASTFHAVSRADSPAAFASPTNSR